MDPQYLFGTIIGVRRVVLEVWLHTPINNEPYFKTSNILGLI